MRHERVHLEEVVESLADGADIDWAALEGRVGSDGDRRVLDQLRILARIAEVHRSHANEPEEPQIPLRGFGGKVIPMPALQPADATAAAAAERALAAGMAGAGVGAGVGVGASALAGASVDASADASAGAIGSVGTGVGNLPNGGAGTSSTPGASGVPGETLLRWNHLELYDRIGEGTYGEVFRARDTQLDREVAVKLLRVGGVSTDRQTRRVLREARSLARVEHPNVVRVYGAEARDGRVGLWMELIEGATLSQLLRAHGPFSAREAAFIGQDLCSALAAVHNAGLVHRDIKAQNVMREAGGRLVLMDFGAGQLATRAVPVAGRDTGGRDTSARDAAALDFGGRDVVRRDLAGRDLAGHDAAGREGADRNSADRNSADRNGLAVDVERLSTGGREGAGDRSAASRDPYVPYVRPSLRPDVAGGRITGTPLYLAPELLEGGEATTSSDIYSLGVLLYHLVTGDYPTRANSLDELRDAHVEGRRVRLHDARPELPGALTQAIERALDPNPANRYATAGEMRAALTRAFPISDPALVPEERARGGLSLPRSLTSGYRHLQIARKPWTVPVVSVAALICVAIAAALLWQTFARTSPAAGTPPRVIAVLDLARGGGVTEYDVAGVTEGLHDLLSTVDTLRVVSRHSVRAASRNDPSTPELAARLGVDTLIEGRLEQGDSNGFRLSLRLVRAGNDSSVPLGTFTAPLGKRPVLLRPAAEAAARVLGVKLPHAADARSRSTEELANDAHDRYARARYYLNTGANRGHPEVAVQLFEEAIVAAPAYGEAYAGLARARYHLALNSRDDLWAHLTLAREAASRALSLDSTLAEAQAVMGIVDFYDWKWEDAERAFKRAVALNPSNEFAAERYAMFLAARGRVEEGLAHLVQLRRIDPMSPLVACSTASVLQYAGRYDEALGEVQRSHSLDPTDPVSHIVRGRILAATGRFDDAIAEFQQVRGSAAGVRWALAEIAAAHAGAGRREEASRMLGELEAGEPNVGERFQPELLAFVHAQLGEYDRAFDWLEKAMEERSPRVLWLKVDPRTKPLRNDPRFLSLLARLELRP